MFWREEDTGCGRRMAWDLRTAKHIEDRWEHITIGEEQVKWSTRSALVLPIPGD